jgi:hypothetical protein
MVGQTGEAGDERDASGHGYYEPRKWHHAYQTRQSPVRPYGGHSHVHARGACLCKCDDQPKHVWGSSWAVGRTKVHGWRAFRPSAPRLCKHYDFSGLSGSVGRDPCSGLVPSTTCGLVLLRVWPSNVCPGMHRANACQHTAVSKFGHESWVALVFSSTFLLRSCFVTWLSVAPRK